MSLRNALIEDVGRWYRLATIQLAGLGAALSGAWLACPDSLRNMLPQHLQTYFAIFTFVMIMFARVVKQPAPPIEEPKQ